MRSAGKHEILGACKCGISQPVLLLDFSGLLIITLRIVRNSVLGYDERVKPND